MPIDIITYIITGLLAGLVLGMLGSGSSLIILPVLSTLFLTLMGGKYAMHLAVGTSMACLFIGALFTMLFKLKQDRELPWEIFKSILPACILGVIVATFLSPYIPAHILKIYVGVFVLLAGLQMLFRKPIQTNDAAPCNHCTLFIVSFFIAALSGVAGLAIGILLVPFLNYLKLPIAKAILISVVATVTYTFFGTLGYIGSGLQLPNLPIHSIGLIYWPAFLIISAALVVMIPVGVKCASKISHRKLQIGFAIFILIAACNLLISAIS